MRTLAYGVIVLVLAVGCDVVGADEPSVGPSPQQQAAAREQATGQEPVAKQPTVDHSGPEPAPAVAPFDAEQAKRHQEAWAKYLGVPVELTNSIGMEFVLIPPGEFMMGSGESTQPAAGILPWIRQAEQIPRSKRRQLVRMTGPYFLGMHEVTQEQYQQVMRVNPSSFKGPQHPVDTVSWDDAVEFCRRLSALPEENVAGHKYRLPTEADWEYACRAGSGTAFSFGGDSAGLGDYAWFVANSQWTTHIVGQKRPNAWGVYDMHGNVMEWCEVSRPQANEFLGNMPINESAEPDADSHRVARGGCWTYGASMCKSAFRIRSVPSQRRYSLLGFRVAVDVAEKVEPPKEGK